MSASFQRQQFLHQGMVQAFFLVLHVYKLARADRKPQVIKRKKSIYQRKIQNFQEDWKHSEHGKAVEDGKAMEEQSCQKDPPKRMKDNLANQECKKMSMT